MNDERHKFWVRKTAERKKNRTLANLRKYMVGTSANTNTTLNCKLIFIWFSGECFFHLSLPLCRSRSCGLVCELFIERYFVGSIKILVKHFFFRIILMSIYMSRNSRCLCNNEGIAGRRCWRRMHCTVYSHKNEEPILDRTFFEIFRSLLWASWNYFWSMIRPALFIE